MRFWPFRKSQEERTISFQDLWGSGRDVARIDTESMDAALSLIPVFAATRLLANSIAALPLQTFRKTAKQGNRQINDPQLVTNPTAYGTTYDWIHRLVTSLALRGNAYGLVVERDRNGIPTVIEWLDPDEVSLQDNRSIAQPIWYYQGRTIDNRDFVHIPWFTVPGFIKGLSPVGAYQTTLATGLHAQAYGNQWFKNGSIPSGVLETDQPVTQEQSGLIKGRFKKAADGRDVVVLGMGVKFKPISVMPEEAQFLGTLKATANQIAAIYGVPATRIGGQVDHSLTYQNAEQESIRFVSDTLQPYLTKIEMALSALLPRGQYVKFNLDSLLRADTLTRYQAHHFALSDGWKNRDEIREIEDMTPLPNGEGQEFQISTTDPPGPPGPDTNGPPGSTPND